MTLYEDLRTTEQSEEVRELTTSQRAAGMADHWSGFIDGRETGFLAYFMLENNDHEEVRRELLELIKASSEIPYPDRQPVLKAGRAILWAFSNTYEDGSPFDVTYVGEHIDSLQ